MIAKWLNGALDASRLDALLGDAGLIEMQNIYANRRSEAIPTTAPLPDGDDVSVRATSQVDGSIGAGGNASIDAAGDATVVLTERMVASASMKFYLDALVRQLTWTRGVLQIPTEAMFVFMVALEQVTIATLTARRVTHLDGVKEIAVYVYKKMMAHLADSNTRIELLFEDASRSANLGHLYAGGIDKLRTQVMEFIVKKYVKLRVMRRLDREEEERSVNKGASVGFRPSVAGGKGTDDKAAK